MSEIIKMDYRQMQDMSRTFKDSAQQLEATTSEIQRLAQILANGALVGDAGETFCHGLDNVLIPALRRLKDKFVELEGDIIGAMADLRDEDGEAGGRFRN